MQLNYKKTGETGENIIILHGLLGSLDNWHTIAKFLSENYRVYTIDQRNHGRSPHSEEMNYEVLANDIVEFCAQQSIQKTIVIGHSMGGKTAMYLALEHPELVKKLIIVDIAPILYEGEQDEILSAMSQAPLQKAKTREEIESFLQPRIPNHGVRQFILKNLSRSEAGGFEWKCNVEALTKNYQLLMDFPSTEKTYEGATYFIRGEQSGYINDDGWAACKKYFPNAELYVVNYAGHWVHADNPEQFLETVKVVLTQ
ncbi:MAG: alpha/beta hydrolase fold protein [Bacteroidota bacterium]|nr:alpha/beta hydrolase fold protein [Bacteroidota bacterium]